MKLPGKLHIDKSILFVCWIIGFIVLSFAVSTTQLLEMHLLSLITLIILLLWCYGFWLSITFKYYKLLVTKIVAIVTIIPFSILALIAQLQTPSQQNPIFIRFSVYLLIGLMIAGAITQSKEQKLKMQMKTEQDKQLD